MANWARTLVDHWHEWNHVFWGWLFGWIRIKVPREFVPIISFIASAAILVAGVNFSVRTVKTSGELHHAIPVMRKVRIFGGGVLVSLGALAALIAIIGGMAISAKVMGYSLEPTPSVFLISMLLLLTAPIEIISHFRSFYPPLGRAC
jgi:hypothetical protein